ncbi:DUF4112 domain-containing protein [Brevundimonas halotolerans]|uniref:DUF4112 domain-containing protein n=1 Tax=Brevundimonas halotolerans TaxID=69670 RepID=A0A7W9A297_9CAUL|nr:DUF4112 domain-containing protein [Brevundimonas halotolerans]MBB5659882.1 hypothetical protein [Brevundimonas halotolerans]
MVKSVADVENVWLSVERIKKISDRVIGIGPFGLGLDALLTWIPGLGTIYTVGAGGWLIILGLRVKAGPGTLARMLGYLTVDTVTGTVPIAGDAIDALFPGHLLAAKALQKHIESTHWVEMSEREARDQGVFDTHREEMKQDRKLKRVVYLGD